MAEHSHANGRATTTNSGKRVVYIRHGQSEANEAYDRDQKDAFIFDPILTARGREQATALRARVPELLNSIDLVVVSPLTRALQTCLIVFEERLGQVPVYVHPLARELMTGSDDVGREPEELSVDFPMFSFDRLHHKHIWWYNDHHHHHTHNGMSNGKESEGELKGELFRSHIGDITALEESFDFDDGETVEEFKQRFKQQGEILEPMPIAHRRAYKFHHWLLAQPYHRIAVVSHGDLIELLAGANLRNGTHCEVELKPDSEPLCVEKMAPEDLASLRHALSAHKESERKAPSSLSLVEPSEDQQLHSA